jgi:hypothetical protein
LKSAGASSALFLPAGFSIPSTFVLFQPMKSVAVSHFPRVFVEQNEKWLFNPILRKRYKNRPEERVRLKWIEYLLHQTSWKRTRVGFETPVDLRQEENRLRADLVLYSGQMKPYILIECKSQSVKLSESAAQQAARYNSTVGAKFIILTNGLFDFCYHLKDGLPEKSTLPFETNHPMPERDSDYWSERGFCSPKSSTALKHWLEAVLNHFWSNESTGDIRYLAFRKSFLPVPMEHHYRVFSTDETTKLAVTFIGYGHSASYLTAILNQKGVNKGVLAINLDKMMDGSDGSVRCFTGNREVVRDAQSFFEAEFPYDNKSFIKNLPEQLIRFFD